MQSTTVHTDWYQNDRGDQMLGVEDDASRFIFDMIETDASSAAQSLELPDQVRSNWSSPVPILEVITDHGRDLSPLIRTTVPVSTMDSNTTYTKTTFSTASVRSADRNQTARSSGFSRPTRSSAGGLISLQEFLDSTTRCDHI